MTKAVAEKELATLGSFPTNHVMHMAREYMVKQLTPEVFAVGRLHVECQGLWMWDSDLASRCMASFFGNSPIKDPPSFVFQAGAQGRGQGGSGGQMKLGLVAFQKDLPGTGSFFKVSSLSPKNQTAPSMAEFGPEPHGIPHPSHWRRARILWVVLKRWDGGVPS